MDFDYSTETITPDNSGILTLNGAVNVQGHWSPSVTSNLAATGSTKDGAALISTTISIVTSIGAGAGVLLPTSVNITAGTQIIIVNSSLYAVNVYPPAGCVINSLGADVPVSISAGVTATFVAITNLGTSWMTNSTSLVAGTNITLTHNQGSITISGTGGGGGSSSVGADGDVQFSDGVGGFTNTTTTSITLQAGNQTTVNGSDINIQAGLSTTTSGGSLYINGGAAGGNSIGGGVEIYSGNGSGQGVAGNVAIGVGESGPEANGGNVEIESGYGGATSGDGGNVIINARGPQSADGNGGSIIINPGPKGISSGVDGKLVVNGALTATNMSINGKRVLTTDDAVGGGTQQIFVQATAPVVDAGTPYIWYQTGLGPLGQDMSIWIEDGL